MTGYLHYLIEQNGYSTMSVMGWIEEQLNKYCSCFVTYANGEFNIIVKWETACYIYVKKFKELLGVHVEYCGLDFKKDLMVFKIMEDELKK